MRRITKYLKDKVYVKDCKGEDYISYSLWILNYILIEKTSVLSIGMCVCLVSSAMSDSLADNCSPLGFSVHRILQARILEWVALPSSRGSSWPRGQTHISCISCIAGRLFTTKPPRNLPVSVYRPLKPYSQYAFLVFFPILPLCLNQIYCHAWDLVGT